MGQNFGALKFIAPPGGALSVTLTLPNGRSPSVYSDAAVTQAAALPLTVSSTQTVYLASPATLVLSVLYNGAQIADPKTGLTQVIDLGPGQVAVRDYSSLGYSDGSTWRTAGSGVTVDSFGVPYITV